MNRQADKQGRGASESPPRYRLFGTIRSVDKRLRRALVESLNGTLITYRLSKALAHDLAENIGAGVVLIVTRPDSLTAAGVPIYVVESAAPVPLPNLTFDPVHWLLSRHQAHP